MKKAVAILAATMLATTLLGGCSSGGSPNQDNPQQAQEVKAEPLNLDGTWKSVNNASDDSWQEAVIDSDTITINWVSDNGDTKSLYWAGTVVEPTEATDNYTWDSENDKDQTSKALLASGSDTKTFTYDNGELSYEASAMGTTKTIKMERQQ